MMSTILAGWHLIKLSVITLALILTKYLLKTKHQSRSLCSTTVTPNSVLMPILMSSGTSDLVSILTSFISKCGQRLSMHIFLAQ